MNDPGKSLKGLSLAVCPQQLATASGYSNDVHGLVLPGDVCSVPGMGAHDPEGGPVSDGEAAVIATVPYTKVVSRLHEALRIGPSDRVLGVTPPGFELGPQDVLPGSPGLGFGSQTRGASLGEATAWNFPGQPSVPTAWQRMEVQLRPRHARRCTPSTSCLRFPPCPLLVRGLLLRRWESPFARLLPRALLRAPTCGRRGPSPLPLFGFTLGGGAGAAVLGPLRHLLQLILP